MNTDNRVVKAWRGGGLEQSGGGQWAGASRDCNTFNNKKNSKEKSEKLTPKGEPKGTWEVNVMWDPGTGEGY